MVKMPGAGGAGVGLELGEENVEDIWVIEDNPADARLTLEAVTKNLPDCRVRVLEDGETALALLRRSSRDGQTPPTLVLLDLNLPRMSGHELLATLKAEPKLRHIPVIILSTSRAEEDRHRAYALGAVDYLVKPWSWDGYVSVGETIGRFCRLQRAIKTERLCERTQVKPCSLGKFR